MTITLINYADEEFAHAQKINSRTGLSVGGFDQYISYTPKDIDDCFRQKNKEIFSQERGAGYWLWKPYIIDKSLQQINDGDYLFYCDSGSYFVDSIDHLINVIKTTDQDILFFELNQPEKQWSKRDAFILMGCDQHLYHESQQRMATFLLIKKSSLSSQFIKEYLCYAQDIRIIGDDDNVCGKENFPGFQENRHDQTILSLLSKKYGFKAFRDPSQWGNAVIDKYPDSSFPQIIELKRCRSKLGQIIKKIKTLTL